MKTLCKLYKYGYLILAMAACLMLASCGKESLDYNHPDVDLFVKQLKTGKYSTQSPEGLSNVPKFAKEGITVKSSAYFRSSSISSLANLGTLLSPSGL